MTTNSRHVPWKGAPIDPDPDGQLRRGATMPTDNLQAKAYRAARTVIHYAKRDSDAVSVLSDGTCEADTETAIFVVKGAERIAYLRGMCERQGLLTRGKPVQAPKTPNAEAGPGAESKGQR